MRADVRKELALVCEVLILKTAVTPAPEAPAAG